MIPSVSADALHTALARFDNELRETPTWANWDSDRRHRFAIQSGGKLYPVKQIVSMATGAAVATFGGGTEANGYVESRGFHVQSTLMPTESEVRIALHELLLSRTPEPVSTADAYKILADVFHLPDSIRTAVMPNGENHWENRVRFARRKLVAAGLMDGADRGSYKLIIRDKPKIWLEKVIVEGRPDRLEGDFSLGKALWSPQRDRSDGDTYALMREVQPGDVVFHLVDNQRLAGSSIVDAYVSTNFTGLPNTEWAGTKAYLVRLRDFQRCDPTLERKHFLGDPALAPELRTVRAAHKNLFYDRELNLNQGFYLTTVPMELASLLDNAYKSQSGRHLPHLDLIPSELLKAGTSPLKKAAGADVLPTQVWVYAPGEAAEHWDEFYADSVMAIGWDELGDLSSVQDLEEVRERMKEVYSLDGDPMNNALACYEFANEMRPGDLVFAKRGRSRIIGYGIVIGDYTFDPERPHFSHFRRIRWDARGDWTVDKKLPTKTLTNITQNEESVEALRRLVGLTQVEDAPEPIPIVTREAYSVENALDGLFMERPEFERMLRIWRSKKNLVLQGSPGVGKTFIAKRLAYALLGFKDPSRVSMIQFHQSYSYEDFIQGYRPTKDGLQLKDGVFLEFCGKAARDPDTDHVFVIDEINRGNLSRIFGELLMLIEPDKRGSNWSMPLTYAQSTETQFSVPKNVYLLGLMNTADRSLAMVDYALRRRFAFFNIAPQISAPGFSAMLQSKGIDAKKASNLIALLTELNEEITADAASLGAGYQIGHSFFCQDIADDAEPAVWLADILETELCPLISEYWSDNSTKAAKWTDQIRGLV